jgi:hypothetical protein
MLMSRYQNAGQTNNRKIANRTFGNVAKFKYLGTTPTNRNLEIKSKLSSVSACYHSAQKLCLLICCLKNVRIKIYRIIILPVVLYGCETLYLILREEHKLMLFENWVLRSIFRHKRD